MSSSSYPHELVVWRVKYRENFHSRSLVQVNSLATITSVSKEPFAHIVWVPQLEEDVSAKPKGARDILYYLFKRVFCLQFSFSLLLTAQARCSSIDLNGALSPTSRCCLSLAFRTRSAPPPFRRVGPL